MQRPRRNGHTGGKKAGFFRVFLGFPRCFRPHQVGDHHPGDRLTILVSPARRTGRGQQARSQVRDRARNEARDAVSGSHAAGGRAASMESLARARGSHGGGGRSAGHGPRSMCRLDLVQNLGKHGKTPENACADLPDLKLPSTSHELSDARLSHRGPPSNELTRPLAGTSRNQPRNGPRLAPSSGIASGFGHRPATGNPLEKARFRHYMPVGRTSSDELPTATTITANTSGYRTLETDHENQSPAGRSLRPTRR